jgi:ankyrin repeat protein
MSAPEDCAEHERYLRIDAAFKTGDMEALRAELGEAEAFPNVEAHPAMGLCLGYAIYWSPLAFVHELLEAGADPNADEGDGFPPLIAAFDRDRSDDRRELLELLLAHGADVDRHGMNDYTALHLAAGRGDLSVVDLLLEHGADPNEITRIDDMETPLELAIAGNHRVVVERLKPLTTRLDWERASKAGDVKTLARMLRAGHDIDKTDGYSQTALMRAAHSGQRDAVEWLIEHGADLNHTSKFRQSALMLAVIAGHPQIARMLAKAGADRTLRGTGAPGFADKTAADLAEDRNDKRLAAYLRQSAPRARA